MVLRVDAGQLEALVAVIFERGGCMRVEAERIAMRLLGANLTGHDSHGVLRTCYRAPGYSCPRLCHPVAPGRLERRGR